MSKKKIYTFRVTHPKYPSLTIIAEGDKKAVFEVARLWGLGWEWAGVVDNAIPLRIGVVKG